jgi:nicotinamide mononucleotide (NMN) deamidase PncC
MPRRRAPRKSGKRGPIGKTGPRGPRGIRGKAGPPGPRGKRDPGTAWQVLADLKRAVETLRSDFETQLRRIAQLQAQLDILLAEFHRMENRQKTQAR